MAGANGTRSPACRLVGSRSRWVVCWGSCWFWLGGRQPWLRNPRWQATPKNRLPACSNRHMIERCQTNLACGLRVLDEFAQVTFDRFRGSAFSRVAPAHLDLFGGSALCQSTGTLQKARQCFRSDVGNGTRLPLDLAVHEYDLAAVFRYPDMHLLGLLVEFVCQNSANFSNRHTIHTQPQAVSQRNLPIGSHSVSSIQIVVPVEGDGQYVGRVYLVPAFQFPCRGACNGVERPIGQTGRQGAPRRHRHKQQPDDLCRKAHKHHAPSPTDSVYPPGKDRRKGGSHACGNA